MRLSLETIRRRMNRNPVRLPRNQRIADKRQKVDVNLAKREVRNATIGD